MVTLLGELNLKLSYIFDNFLSITHKNTFHVKKSPRTKDKEIKKERLFSLIGCTKYDKIYTISYRSYDRVMAARAEVAQYYSL